MKKLKKFWLALILLAPLFSYAAPLSLSQPQHTNAQVLQWTENAIKNTFKYKYATYPNDMISAQKFYTANAWHDVQTILTQYLNLVVVHKMSVSADKLMPAVVNQQGVVNNMYTWKILIPILVTYKTHHRLLNQALELTLLVAQVPPNVGDHGLAIIEFQAGE